VAAIHVAAVRGDPCGAVRCTALQFHPDSAWKRSSKTGMKLTSAECTAENS